MRITARPARSVRVIEPGATARPAADAPRPPAAEVPPPSPAEVPPPTPAEAARPPFPAEARALPPPLPGRTSLRPWLAALAAVVVVGGIAAAIVLGTSGSDPGGIGTPPVSTPPTVTGTPTPTSTGTDPGGTVSGTPSPTGTSTQPPPEESDSGIFTGTVLVAVAVVVIGLLVAAALIRRRTSPSPLRQPVWRSGTGAAPGPDGPRASLGMPDVLVLTAATTAEDQRLRDRLAQETSAIFANLQLACSFHPANDWLFKGARLTVVLARADGLAAPAPIAYSLRPLSEQDGTARENNVEIGADVKFVTAKIGEKSTRGGEVFVRGYGLQESTSYWEFTPTRARPLEGSFWLWLIAKAPVETDLAITASLQVQVSPRRWWSKAGRPPVEGLGSVGIVLRLQDGQPYRTDLVDEGVLGGRSDGG